MLKELNMNVYNLSWGRGLDENIVIITNANEEQLQKAIAEKNEMIKNDEWIQSWVFGSDSEILESILKQNNFECEFIILDKLQSFNF